MHKHAYRTCITNELKISIYSWNWSILLSRIPSSFTTYLMIFEAIYWQRLRKEPFRCVPLLTSSNVPAPFPGSLLVPLPGANLSLRRKDPLLRLAISFRPNFYRTWSLSFTCWLANCLRTNEFGSPTGLRKAKHCCIGCSKKPTECAKVE